MIGVMSNYELTYRATGVLAYPMLRWRAVERLLGRLVLSRADLVLAGNDDNRRFIEAAGAAPHRSFTVRTIGIAEGHFAPLSERRELRTELQVADRPLLLYLGRLSPEKYPADLLTAIAALRPRFPDALLLMAGDGPQRIELQREARRLGLGEHVRFLGMQEPARVRDLLFTADVILSPLTGSALVEAALAATPIVAYDVEWHSELILDGITGILVPYRDAEAMGRAASRILADPELGRRLGLAARERALEQHHPKVVYARERELIERFILGRRTDTVDRAYAP
jgi:glycosyltransferase involved in cell wall biosynthesis